MFQLNNRLVLSLTCLFHLQLQMLGYDISWAAFNVIEVMSSPKFTHKVSSSNTQYIYMSSID